MQFMDTMLRSKGRPLTCLPLHYEFWGFHQLHLTSAHGEYLFIIFQMLYFDVDVAMTQEAIYLLLTLPRDSAFPPYIALA